MRFDSFTEPPWLRPLSGWIAAVAIAGAVAAPATLSATPAARAVPGEAAFVQDPAGADTARADTLGADVGADTIWLPLEPVEDVRVDRDGDYRPDREGERVRVRGTILSEARPTGRSSDVINFQDSTGGIVLYRDDTVTLSGLRPGDRVEVVGRVAEDDGMEEIRVERLSRLGRGERPEPLDVTAAEVKTEAMQGRLVRVRGLIGFGDSGFRPVVADETGEIPIYMRAEFLDEAGFGERLYSARRGEITGIAAQSSAAPPHDDGYDLMPRGADDFVLTPTLPYRMLGFILALVVLGALAAYAMVRRRRAERQTRRLERLTEDLEARDMVLEAVAYAAERFLGDDDLEEQLEDALARLLTAIDAVGAALIERRTATRGARVVGSQGLSSEMRDALEAFSDGARDHPGVRRWTERTKAGEVVHEVPLKDPDVRSMLAEHGIRGHLLVPVFVGSRWWGLLAFYTDRPNRGWSEVEIEALTAASSIVGAAIARRAVQEALHQSEEQFRQAQKMEAVGRLAGGIAHDFNNLLTAMRGHGELLAENERLEDASEDVEEILRSVDRASELTRQLLAFSRYQALPSQVTDASAVVLELLPMLRRLIGEHIQLEVETEDNAWVRLPPGQLEQVVVNLCVNARDAMEGGGQIRISTGFEEQRKTPMIVLRVSDTGTGMDPQTAGRAMEPFFTTKPAGSGTGLGLSTVYGIATKAGGNVSLESAPGEGTDVAVCLPAASAPAPSPPGTASAETAFVPEGKTVLVVEDEPAVRKLAIRVLEKAGYRVLEAEDGPSAIDVVDRAEPIDLLLTDVRMPGMTGPEVLDEVRKRQPDVPALFISGYAAEELPLESVSPDVFLEKPFSPRELVRRVGAAVGGGRGGPSG